MICIFKVLLNLHTLQVKSHYKKTKGKKELFKFPDQNDLLMLYRIACYPHGWAKINAVMCPHKSCNEFLKKEIHFNLSHSFIPGTLIDMYYQTRFRYKV